VADGERPVRTITALAKLFGDRLAVIRVGNVEVHLAPPTAIPTAPAYAPAAAPTATLASLDLPLNDADLALSPPAGMLFPEPAKEDGNN